MILNNCIRCAPAHISFISRHSDLAFRRQRLCSISDFRRARLQIVGNTHVAADFNGDGKIDLAGAGLNARVMLGLVDGSFRPQVEYNESAEHYWEE